MEYFLFARYWSPELTRIFSSKSIRSYQAAILWILLVLGMGSYLHSFHVSALPQTLKPEFLHRFHLNSDHQIHILYTRCGCSRIVAEKILQSPRDFPNQTFFILAEKPESLNPFWTHFLNSIPATTHLLTPQQAEKYGISASPSTAFILKGQIQWMGGYRNGSVSPLLPLEDVRIAAELRHQLQPPDTLPIIGCASSRKLQKKQDPFGFKSLFKGEP